jgi:NAD kinase
MKKNLVLILVLIFTISCNINNDCGECFTPPRQFNFDFVDKDTQENLFVNDTFEMETITVVDENNDNVNFQIVFYNDSYILSLSEIGWNTNPKVYTINLNDSLSVIFELDMKSVQSECCTFFEVESFNLQTYNYTESSTTGIIQVEI